MYATDDENVYQLKPISKDDPLVKKVEQELEAIKIPTNFSRMNSGVGQSITLGRIYKRYYHKMGNARFDEKFPELKKAIFALGNKIVPFKFSSVQVNHNYKTKPHFDGHNIGMSLIVGLGDYSGGELMVSGKPYNIKYKPTIFNGALHLHSTKPFTNDRYSLVFFKTLEYNTKAK